MWPRSNLRAREIRAEMASRPTDRDVMAYVLEAFDAADRLPMQQYQAGLRYAMEQMRRVVRS